MKIIDHSCDEARQVVPEDFSFLSGPGIDGGYWRNDAQYVSDK